MAVETLHNVKVEALKFSKDICVSCLDLGWLTYNRVV